MQFTFDIDLQGIVDKTMSPENIAPILEAAITKAFKAAVDSATGYRSEFSTKLEAQLKEALPHGLHLSDVAKFQNVLNEAVTNAVHGANAETVKAAMQKVAANALPDLPARLKLSELMEMARDGFHKEAHEAFFAELELSDYGFAYLYLDSSERPSRSNSFRSDHQAANFKLSISKDGDVFAMRYDGMEMTPSKLPTVIGKFEGVLLSLYTGRTTIEVDMDEHAVKSAAEAQYD